MLTSLLNPVLRLHAVYGTQLSYVNVSRLNDNVMNETETTWRRNVYAVLSVLKYSLGTRNHFRRQPTDEISAQKQF